jgi:hypothetical protein
MCHDTKGRVYVMWDRFWYNERNALINMLNLQLSHPANVYYIKEH